MSISITNSIIEWIIHYRRLVFSMVALLVVIGIMALSSMARQEDPSFPYRAGLIKVVYPGASPDQIEQLITDPLEEELAQVSEIDVLNSLSRDDIAIFEVDLLDSVYDTDGAWDRVQDAIERARLSFPAGVTNIEFDDRKIDMPAAVISITGSDDALILDNAANTLKKQLLTVPGVSRIETEGAPERELIVKLDQQTINRLGVSRQFVANTLAQRNQIIPGGLVSKTNRNIRLNTQSDFATIRELESTILPLKNGQLVPLNAIADVSLEPKLPLAAQVFKDGRRAVSLGVIAQRGQIDTVKFGQQLRARLEQLRPQYQPLQLEESFFQPDYVSNRLASLQKSLMVSVLIIALVIFFAMGWRTGILVSLVLPIVSLVSLGLYSAGGGVFHQMAVIGIVISLGILIDNAIVVIESIEASLRAGKPAANVIRDTVRVLAKPLMASTGTTVAAFIPLLLAEGGVGDFTRAVPIMITIALIVSYLISVFVLPLIAFYWLKPKPAYQADSLALRFTNSLAEFCANLVEHKTKLVLFGALMMVATSALLAPTLKQEFFPSTDRAQIVIDLELPNNTPLATTELVSKEIEQQLLKQDSVAAIYRAVGGAGFRFYYNLTGGSNESHSARLTVNTTHQKHNLPLVKWVRQNLKPKYPDVMMVPRLLGQGPPRAAPIEIRVKHSVTETLFSASQTVKKMLSQIEGVSELRSNLDLGTPELSIDIQENATLSLGLQPNDVASAVFAESRGLSAGEYRYAADPIPIRVRSSKGQATSLETVENQYIYAQSVQSKSSNGPSSTLQPIRATPINQLAAMTPNWSATTIRHHNGVRTVKVLAQVEKGYAFNQILTQLKLMLAQNPLQNDVVIEYGGDAAASSEANSSIATSVPIAIGLLIFFMMFQFNSFRRIAIVFSTIPLAAVGVIPGLVLSGQPFGFQSLLGVIALVGIVVNNAIVLIDVIDQELADDKPIRLAVRNALQQRTAPIILTTATTICGLLPLALSSSTLWPPMAWAIISGLLLSTVLTLVAIPALCVLVLGKKRQQLAPIQTPGLALALSVVFSAVLLVDASKSTLASETETNEFSNSISLRDVIKMVDSNRQLAAAQQDLNAAKATQKSVSRQAWAPKLSVGGEYAKREETSLIDLPGTELVAADDSSYVYELKLTQPLFQPSLQRYQTIIAESATESSAAELEFVKQHLIGEAVDQYLTVLSLRESRKSKLALQDSLLARRDRIAKELDLGRALKTDLLQIEVELNGLKQQIVVLDNQLKVSKASLLQLLNLPVETTIKIQPVDNIVPNLENDSPTINDKTLGCLAREDCFALEAKLKGLQSQAKGVSASGLPTINLSLAQRRSDGLLFVDDKDQRAMLEFSWAIFSGGERKHRKRAIQANAEALKERIIALQQSIQIERLRAKSAYENSLSELQLNKQTVSLSEERLKLSRKRYDNGLLNLDQLLDAEAGVTSSAAALSIAKIELVRAWVNIKLATGEKINIIEEE